MTEKKGSLIVVSASVSKDLEVFLRALYSFSRMQCNFKEWLGSKLAQSVQADFTDNLESTLNMEHILHNYGLDKLPEFKDC